MGWRLRDRHSRDLGFLDMHLVPLTIDGAFTIVPEPIVDDRGFFARVFCAETFAKAGLVAAFAQSSISFNTRIGTLRGMHYSVGDHAETKLVRCTTGAIHDVIVDIRPHSPTSGMTLAVALTADTRAALYIPAGVAHGFQTLEADTEVLYMIDKPFVADAARGLRWNDAVVETRWPLPVGLMSDRDRTYPDFVPGAS
jgi:dTDP-4-dehydrorhamnose 3,5-epimerase